MTIMVIRPANNYMPSQYILPVLMGVMVLLGLYASSLYNYILFHSLVEIFSVIVSFVIFVLAWNTRRVLDNHYILFLGIAALFTGALEMVHAFAYKGFGVFPGHDANLPTQLWVAFRYVFSLSFLFAPFFIRRRMNIVPIFALYAAVTFLLFRSIFSGVFPDCFVEGRGLTPFKIISEYVIIFILLAALGLLIRNRNALDRRVYRLMIFSILSATASEFSFTIYESVVGLSNMVGHLFLLISVYLIYRAIVVIGVIEPSSLLFRNLKLSEGALRKTHDELDQKVRERTEELRKVADTLQGEIFERTEQEKELRHVHAKLQAMFESIGDGFFTLDRGWHITFANTKALRFWRKDREAAVGKLILEIDPMARGTIVEENFARVMNARIPADFEVFSTAAERWIEVRAYPWEEGISVYFHDITERKETEARILVTSNLLKLTAQTRSRKEFLDAALSIIKTWTGCGFGGIRITDNNNHIPYISCAGFHDAFLESENVLSLDGDICACTRVILQRPEPQDRAAMTPGGSFYTNNSKKFMESLSAGQQARFRGMCIRSGYQSIAVIPIRHRDQVFGAIHLADSREGMLPLEHVELLEQSAIIIGEAVLRFNMEEERARLVFAVEASAEAVVITDPVTGIIQYVNRAFEAMTGYTKQETLGRVPHILDSGKHDEKHFREVRESLRRDGFWKGIVINKRKDGTSYYEDCVLSPVMGPSGELINYISLKRDVTEELRLKAIAESVNTLDNIGYVFAGVRHEIGNPINSVKMILGILRAKLDDIPADAVKDYLGRMTDQIERVEYVLRSLKSFNLYETQLPQNLDLASFMENFLALIRDDFEKKGIVIGNEIERAVKATADPRALQQVLLNIFTNASDALQGRREPKIMMNTFRSGGTVRISVHDNGCGISDEKKKDLFKPFFTTKANGTGLGLVIVKKMLSNMNGTIEIEGRDNIGTVVTITLPEGADEGQ